MTIDRESNPSEPRTAKSTGITPDGYTAKLTALITPTVTSVSPAAVCALTTGPVACGSPRLSA